MSSASQDSCPTGGTLKTKTCRGHFLSLSPEIRRMIYTEYLLIEGGYTLNYETGKLVTAANEPIDLRLMRTCSQVRIEMTGLALWTNTITFKTLHSEELHLQAARFRQFQKRGLDNGLEAMLTHVLPLLDTSMVKRINDEFGQDIVQCFKRLLDGWGPAQKSPYRDDALAFSYDARRKTLQLAVTDPAIHHHLSTNYLPRLMTACSPSRGNFDLPIAPNALSVDDILALERGIDSWLIPTQQQLDDLTRNPYYYGAGWWMHRDQDEEITLVDGVAFSNELSIIRRFSAAAAAIDFLTSLPVATRNNIRNIVVHEDHASISGPADILGLVPFCYENPDLRVQQRVDIWSAVMSHHRWFQRPSWFWETDRSWDWRDPYLTFQENFPKVLSSHLSMFDHGAVPQAITAVFVAEDLPEWTRAMVHRSVAEVTAWVKWVRLSTSHQADCMWFQGHYIARSWLTFVGATICTGNLTGQVRFEFALDPRLANVLSDATMFSEVTSIIARRKERFDVEMHQWWMKSDLPVHLPAQTNSVIETFFYDRTKLRQGEQHPPTTMDAIIPAPGGTPYQPALGPIPPEDNLRPVAYSPDLMQLLASAALPASVTNPGGHGVLAWLESLPGPGEFEQVEEADSAANPLQEKDQEGAVPSTSNTVTWNAWKWFG